MSQFPKRLSLQQLQNEGARRYGSLKNSLTPDGLSENHMMADDQDANDLNMGGQGLSEAENAAYSIGDQVFISMKTIGGNAHRGDETTWHGRAVKLVEKDEYPFGNPGWWARILSNSNDDDDLKEDLMRVMEEPAKPRPKS